MCVDFSKAFDSIEHEMIRSVMGYFGFGVNMIGMVMTLLNDRKSRILIYGVGYSNAIVTSYYIGHEKPRAASLPQRTEEMKM
jgi:hypothetical protein